MAFKDYMQNLRNERQDTIKELAALTCSSTVSVYRWMDGSITPPLLKQKIIADHLNIPVEVLFPVNNQLK